MTPLIRPSMLHLIFLIFFFSFYFIFSLEFLFSSGSEVDFDDYVGCNFLFASVFLPYGQLRFGYIFVHLHPDLIQRRSPKLQSIWSFCGTSAIPFDESLCRGFLLINHRCCCSLKGIKIQSSTNSTFTDPAKQYLLFPQFRKQELESCLSLSKGL
jgi:hypothetical protein